MIVIKTLVISSQPYAQWLAESLSFLENRKIDKIAIVAIDKTNGEVITGYHDCTFADKAVMAAKPMQYTEVYWLMQIKSYKRQRISLTAGMTKTNYKNSVLQLLRGAIFIPISPP